MRWVGKATYQGRELELEVEAHTGAGAVWAGRNQAIRALGWEPGTPQPTVLLIPAPTTIGPNGDKKT